MPGDDRFNVALGHFERALSRLNEALAEPESDFLRDSVIQRFEFTFEAAWKAMYRWLRARGVDIDEDAYSVIPEAFKRRLVVDEKQWGDMRKFRNLTSHTCDEKLAVEVAAFVRAAGAATLGALALTLRARGDE